MRQKKENKNHPKKVNLHVPQKQKTPIFWMYLIIVAVACIPYFNAIPNEYALDDSMVLTSNQFVLKGVSGIGDILTHDTFSGFFGRDSKALVGGRYRPLSLVTFAIENSLFGLSPHMSHFINIILYAFCGIMLFMFLRNVFPGYNLLLPFVMVLLYIAHPVHVEAVANIKGRDEILSLFFLVSSLHLLFQFLKRPASYLYVTSLLMFFLSLLSKENAITFVLIIPLFVYYFTKEKSSRNLALSSGFLVVTLLFLLMRSQFAAGTGANVTEVLNNSFAGASWDQKFATIADIMNRYFLLLLFPYPLSFDYSFNQIPIIEMFDWRAILGFLIHISLLVYAVLHFRKKDVFSFCIFFFYISISIVSNVFFPVGTSMSERFLFIPSLAFSIVFVCMATRLFQFKIESTFSVFFANKTFVISILGILTIYSSLIYARNPIWKNNFSLFTHDVEICPQSVKALIGAGGEYVAKAARLDDVSQKKVNLEKAITYLTKAVVIYPAYSNAWMLLGNAYFGLYNSPDTAIYYYKKAIAYNDTYMDAYYNIGYLLTGKKNREAISAFKQVLVSNPKHLESLYHMALCYKNIQLMDSALYCLDQIKGMNTNSLKVYQLAGLIYGETNQIDKAIIELSRAVEMDSEQAENYLNLGIAYGKKADWEKAISVLNKASQLAPENANIWMALGVTFQNAGNTLKANENFEKAFSINPSLKNRH